jgi:hypothetical protein
MLEFTREYGIRTHGNQRAGLSPRSIPHLQTVEELMQKSRRIEDSLKRIREMVIAQNHAMEQQMKDSGRSGPGSYSDMNGYSDDKPGMGGFAGGDTKKRRGVSSQSRTSHSNRTNILVSELLHQVVVIAAIELKLQNGGEVRTVLVHCAMHVDFVRMVPSDSMYSFTDA